MEPLHVITLLEQLTLLLREELAPYASEQIPSLGADAYAGTTVQRVPSLAALGALDEFGFGVGAACRGRASA